MELTFWYRTPLTFAVQLTYWKKTSNIYLIELFNSKGRYGCTLEMYSILSLLVTDLSVTIILESSSNATSYFLRWILCVNIMSLLLHFFIMYIWYMYYPGTSKDGSANLDPNSKDDSVNHPGISKGDQDHHIYSPSTEQRFATDVHDKDILIIWEIMQFNQLKFDLIDCAYLELHFVHTCIGVLHSLRIYA